MDQCFDTIQIVIAGYDTRASSILLRLATCHPVIMGTRRLNQ